MLERDLKREVMLDDYLGDLFRQVIILLSRHILQVAFVIYKHFNITAFPVVASSMALN
jgi:hypothetical protein